MSTSERIYTSTEAAAYLGVTTRTLARWRESHRGPAYINVGTRLRASYRYRSSDLKAWEQAHRKDPR